MPRIHAMKGWVQRSDGELFRYRLCDLVLKDRVVRSRALGLVSQGTEDTTMESIATALTAHVMQYLVDGHYRVSL